MDFSRTTQAQPAASNHGSGGGSSASSKKSKRDSGFWSRVGVAVFSALLIIILIFAIVALSTGTAKKESSYINSDQLQAVFLNTGQVYFGNIKSLNNRYLVLTNIYYLQTANGSNASTANTNSNVSLVKLGCELHEPFDQMLINRDQVTFWENLQDNGQVAKAVATFEKQNPNGQKCADQSTSSSNSSSSAAQNAGTSSTPAKP